jgi:hypothetical protein
MDFSSLSVVSSVTLAHRFAVPQWDETVCDISPGGRSENSPGRGPREQVFVRGVEDKRSAVLGLCPIKAPVPEGRCEVHTIASASVILITIETIRQEID